MNMIQKDEPKIHCNRPFELTNVPIALLHPVFGEFRDLSLNAKPTPDDNHAALVLTGIMLEHYPTKAERLRALHYFFLTHLSVQLHLGRHVGTTSQTDGHGYANPNSSPPFIHILTECKNELTENSTDPYFHATLLFKDYLQTFETEGNIYSKTVFPVMVVLAFGKYLALRLHIQ
jgi:hypothetical protein